MIFFLQQSGASEQAIASDTVLNYRLQAGHIQHTVSSDNCVGESINSLDNVMGEANWFGPCLSYMLYVVFHVTN